MDIIGRKETVAQRNGNYQTCAVRAKLQLDEVRISELVQYFHEIYCSFFLRFRIVIEANKHAVSLPTTEYNLRSKVSFL